MSSSSTLNLTPITLRQARQFITAHHRHNIAPRGWRFGVGILADAELVGVAVGGRPVARHLDDGTTLEVTRTCTDGTPNANSMLYGAIGRAAKALGYARLVTYTLESEPGTSLRASGWEPDAEVSPAPTWNRSSRVRYNTDLFGAQRRPTGTKHRWTRILR
jgi:hypothetical protein